MDQLCTLAISTLLACIPRSIRLKPDLPISWDHNFRRGTLGRSRVDETPHGSATSRITTSQVSRKFTTLLAEFSMARKSIPLIYLPGNSGTISNSLNRDFGSTKTRSKLSKERRSSNLANISSLVGTTSIDDNQRLASIGAEAILSSLGKGEKRKRQ